MLNLILLFFNSIAIADTTPPPKFTVTLRLDANAGNFFYRNEPLIFSTSLVNNQYLNDLQWNQAADEGLKKLATDYGEERLSKEEFDRQAGRVTGGKKTLKPDTVGSHESPWFAQLRFIVFVDDSTELPAWPIDLLGDPLTDSVAVLDENGYYLVKHHLPPERNAGLQPGTYKVQAVLAGVRSNAVTVKIKPETMPAAVAGSRKMQLRLGNYYLWQKQADKAMIYAASLLKKNPADISALVLKGEALILKEQYNQALAAFETALKLHRKQNPRRHEPPRYLLGKIARLKKR